MNVSEHLTKRVKDIFPDSKIAEEVQMSRTKCSCIIRNVLGQCIFEELVSLLIDESTDIGSVKNLCICVRYFSVKSESVRTRFFQFNSVFFKS